MRNQTVRTVALGLSAAMALSMTALGADSGTKNADRLHALGLFQGTDSGYALEKTPTRLQGLIMLIRLLGEESEALSSDAVNPFTDVAEGNPSRYVAYAYEKGYTSGTSATTFSPGGSLNFRGYVTFLLRALGYHDQAGDFSYQTCLQKAAELGFITASSAGTIAQSNPTFYRSDLVDLSVCALTTSMKEGGETLAGKLISDGVFTQAQADAQQIGAQESYTYQSKDYSTISRVTNTYSVASGKVTADVITVNTLNPNVSVKTAMVDNKLGHTGNFASIAANSGAAVVVDGNFFEAYNDKKFPIGHVMVNGQFLYGVSGLTSFGFTDSGEIRVGRPAVFFYVEGDGVQWACYECNSRGQSADTSILYTPAYGASAAITSDGVATVVSNGVIQSSQPVSAGGSVAIPSDGYVMFFGTAFTQTEYYRAPVVGSSVTMTPRLTKADENGFTLEGVTSIVSGGPRLVENGQICTTLEPGFQEARFTSNASSRTAIGKLSNGKLVIVSTGKATIQQMRELMLQLGCVDAVNLDGGASTALAYQGKVIRNAGRALTTTLQVFVNG